MNSVFNRFGLSRYIPEDIKRQIRINSGFGCVICGTAIVEYEHVDPEFKDASSHESKGITLLCPSCHAKKTRKFLFKNQIEAAMLNPIALQKGFIREHLNFGNEFSNIILGGIHFSKCHSPITISNESLIHIKEPETANSPYRLSAIFFDSTGNVSLRIIDNEWEAYTSNWDIEVSGGQIRIKDASQMVHLILSSIDSKTIKIEKLVSKFDSKLLLVLDNYLRVVDVKTGNSKLELIDCDFKQIIGNCLSL